MAETETAPQDGSLNSAAAQFASLFSAQEEKQASEQQPEQQPETVAEQAPAAPETSESEQAESNESDSEQPTPQAKTYQVKVDGQVVEVTEDELIKSYSLEKHRNNKSAEVNRRAEELAAQKREFEEKEVSAVRQERAQYGEYLAKWVDVLKANTPVEPDPSKMEPGEFAVEWVKWKQHTDHVAQAQAEQARVQAVQAADADKGFRAYVRSEQAKLADAIPAFNDPEQSKTLKGDLIAYAKTRGFTESDFEQVTDHRLVVLLHDAMQGQKAKAKAPEIKQRIDKVLESPRPGANTQPAKTDETKAAIKRLKENGGRIDDAAKAFATIFK